MAPLAVLARDVVETALKDLPGLGLDQDKLYREFVFEDFSQAFAFMSRVELASETADHHPEWFNVYNRVVVDLTTHDAGGITELDLQLARRMEALAP